MQPFDLSAISWKINNYNGEKTKAMITFHVDARAVQERLNTIIGIENWSFEFSELQQDKGAHGKLIVDFGEKKVMREDVGYPNEVGKKEWYKDAVSDALKRCAVHFGIGHFLYALPSYWIELEQTAQKFLSNGQNVKIKSWLEVEISKIKKAKSIQIIAELPQEEIDNEIEKITTKDSVKAEEKLVVAQLALKSKRVENAKRLLTQSSTKEEFKKNFQQFKDLKDEPEIKLVIEEKARVFNPPVQDTNPIPRSREVIDAAEIEAALDNRTDFQKAIDALGAANGTIFLSRINTENRKLYPKVVETKEYTDMFNSIRDDLLKSKA